MIIIVMGVSGSGKSRIGKAIASKLQLPFFDADDFHPKVNIKKMAGGTPLKDNDRLPWLKKLSTQIHLWQKDKGAVLACSALKNDYRSILGPTNIYILLDGSFELIQQRLSKRSEHFMPESLLKSQFATLEKPNNGIVLSIDNSVDNIVNAALKEIKQHGR